MDKIKYTTYFCKCPNCGHEMEYDDRLKIHKKQKKLKQKGLRGIDAGEESPKEFAFDRIIIFASAKKAIDRRPLSQYNKEKCHRQ